MAESLVQGINGTLALNAHQFRDAVLDGLFSFEEFRLSVEKRGVRISSAR
jgi:hypothetical protein